MLSLTNKEALAIAVLSALIFIYASETAATIDHKPKFNYLNPTYITMVMTAIVSLSVCGYMTLKLYHTAEKKANQLKKVMEQASQP